MKALLFKSLVALLRSLVRITGKVIYRLRITGSEHVPGQGGALVVANHTSFMDFVLIVCAMPRHVRFVMNAHTFAQRGLNWLMRGMNCVPVETGMGKDSLEEFNRVVIDQLDNGHLVVIFAEGTVSRTGQLLEFKKGVEHLSKRISVPIIPVHFDNVHGSPYTFRAGKRKMIVPSWKSLRRLVHVNIGAPVYGETTAFTLRQKMKDLEADGFSQRISDKDKIANLVLKNICNTPSGSWSINDESVSFREMGKNISAMHVVLHEHLAHEHTVGVLLPKSLNALLVNLYLLVNDKCMVNIDPQLDNEERMFVCKQAGINTIITTKDISFTPFAPNAQQVIYAEDIRQAMESGKKFSPMCPGAKKFREGMMNWFRTTPSVAPPVTIIFEKKNDSLVAVPLTNRNLLAVVTALRQIYFFRKGSTMLADLDLFHSFGFVLEFLVPLISDLQLETLPEHADEKNFIAQLEQHQPSLVLTTPTQLKALAELSQLRNLPFLTNIFTADIDPTHDAVEVLTERGLPVMTCAGLNETSSVFAVNVTNVRGKDIAGKDLEQENYERSSIGKPLPGIALRIMNENDLTCEMNVGEAGRIFVRGASISSVADDDRFTADGWLDTGWKGFMNNKGFVFLN